MGKEDAWAFVRIGERFPEDPVRVAGEANQFVALWYRNGLPIFGRAWNNGGVVECSFPGQESELIGKRDIRSGVIQILTLAGSFLSNGFWYDWHPFAAVKAEQAKADRAKLKQVFCGSSAPICLKTRKGGTYLGNLDMRTERACVAFDGQVEKLDSAQVIGAMLVLCRNLAPPPCADPERDGYGHLVVQMGGVWGDDLWRDFRVGDAFPPHTVAAAGRPLNYDGTEPRPTHSVAKWYQQGVPIMGRAWPEDGKIEVSFGWNGREYSGAKCGSVQLLQHHVPASHGFDYEWAPFSELAEPDAAARKDGWAPVEMAGICPAVCITKDGFERLGQLDLRLGCATHGFDDGEVSQQGAHIAPALVLVKNHKPKPA